MSTITSRVRRRVFGVAIVALVLGGAGVTFAVDTNPANYATLTDDAGRDDQPGQKDLTMQGGDNSASGYIDTFIQWDDLSVSGGNTLDGCSLVDTDGDDFVNAAICVSLARLSATSTKLKSWTVYRCNDSRTDGCGVVSSTTPSSTAVTDDGVVGCSAPVFPQAAALAGDPTADTRVYCTITRTAAGVGSQFNLRNTCSYPSASPTSAPSDCVLKVRATATGTTSATELTWLVPNASLSIAATGTVTFNLYPVSGGSCVTTTAEYTETVSISSGVATTTNATEYFGTGAEHPAGTYGWVITYSGNADYNPVSYGCVEQFTAA